MIYARIKISEDTDIKLVNVLIDILESDDSVRNVDFTPDKRDIKVNLPPDVEALIFVEAILLELFLTKGTIQMDISMDSYNKEAEQAFNYRYSITPSLNSPEKQFLLKLFPAKDLFN